MSRSNNPRCPQPTTHPHPRFLIMAGNIFFFDSSIIGGLEQDNNQDQTNQIWVNKLKLGPVTAESDQITSISVHFYSVEITIGL